MARVQDGKETDNVDFGGASTRQLRLHQRVGGTYTKKLVMDPAWVVRKKMRKRTALRFDQLHYMGLLWVTYNTVGGN